MVDTDVIIVGDLCENDLIMAEHLSMHGFNCKVIRKSKDNHYIQTPDIYFNYFNTEEGVIYTDSARSFIRHLKRAKLIVSITGTLLVRLKYLYFLKPLLNLPPVINITTGSDISELANEQSIYGKAYRYYLKTVDLNWVLPLPHAVRNLKKYHIKNVIFTNGFPFIFHKEFQKNLNLYKEKRPLKLFHCSNFDWNYTDFRLERNSIKKNDLFVYALIKALDNDLDFECLLLERGPDWKVAKEMLAKAGYENDSRLEWREHLSREELYNVVLESDIVVNMFGHGGAGGISFECMALGTPVMQRAHRSYFNLMYKNLAPFLNAETVDDIYQHINHFVQHRGELVDVALAGREWADQFINPENSLDTFMFYYDFLTGDEKLDTGSVVEQYQAHSDSVINQTYDPFDFDKYIP